MSGLPRYRVAELNNGKFIIQKLVTGLFFITYWEQADCNFFQSLEGANQSLALLKVSDMKYDHRVKKIHWL